MLYWLRLSGACTPLALFAAISVGVDDLCGDGTCSLALPPFHSPTLPLSTYRYYFAPLFLGDHANDLLPLPLLLLLCLVFGLDHAHELRSRPPQQISMIFAYSQ